MLAARPPRSPARNVVANVAPNNLVLNPLQPGNNVNENTTVTLSGSFNGQGTGDTHTVTIVWGDTQPNTVLNLAADVFTFSTTHTFLDNPAGNATGSFPISVTVADNANATTVRGGADKTGP